MLEYLYQALASKWGIVVAFSDVTLGRARLYADRKKAADPDLSCLQFRPDPLEPDTKLWIIKGENKDA